MSAMWLMSPKSTMPVMSPSSSTSALSHVRSPCTTWARSDGQRGTTTSSNRSSTRRPTLGRSGRRSRRASCGCCQACCTSHGITRIALGWTKPRMALPSRAVERPQAASARSSSRRGSWRAWPGTRSYSAHPVRAELRRPRQSPRPVLGARHRARPRHRQIGIDPCDVADDVGLHVEGGHRLRRVRDLHHGEPVTARAEQHERAVALAAEVDRRRRLDAESGGDRHGVVGVQGGAGDRSTGSTGSDMGVDGTAATR